ncbi:hypothetical protein ACSW9O_15540 (plasmid) [Clostridium perfringens]
MLKLVKKYIYKLRIKIDDIRFERMIKRDIRKGYIASDGTPLKCHKCGCKEMETYYTDYIEHTLCEESIRCKACKEHLGHWAYGSWRMI